MTISAKDVKVLRDRTAAGMMDCKRALEETGGDMEAAVDFLRAKGAAKAAKRAEKSANEGTIGHYVHFDGKTAVLVEVNCETDFVAKSDAFVATAQALTDFALACTADEGAENVLATAIDGRKFSDLLTEIVSKTGEKTQVGDYAKYKLDGPGLISTYVHFNHKVGTMVQIETGDDATAGAEAIKQTACDIAMHVTATKPLTLDKDQIDPATIEREKAIFAEQVKNKPAEIVDKIVEGKLKKFFAENCLLRQAFVKDDSKTVEQVLANAAKEAGGQAKIRRFVRFELG